MKDLALAYRILSDSDNRKVYDKYGREGLLRKEAYENDLGTLKNQTKRLRLMGVGAWCVILFLDYLLGIPLEWICVFIAGGILSVMLGARMLFILVFLDVTFYFLLPTSFVFGYSNFMLLTTLVLLLNTVAIDYDFSFFVWLVATGVEMMRGGPMVVGGSVTQEGEILGGGGVTEGMSAYAGVSWVWSFLGVHTIILSTWCCVLLVAMFNIIYVAELNPSVVMKFLTKNVFPSMSVHPFVPFAIILVFWCVDYFTGVSWEFLIPCLGYFFQLLFLFFRNRRENRNSSNFQHEQSISEVISPPGENDNISDSNVISDETLMVGLSPPKPERKETPTTKMPDNSEKLELFSVKLRSFLINLLGGGLVYFLAVTWVPRGSEEFFINVIDVFFFFYVLRLFWLDEINHQKLSESSEPLERDKTPTKPKNSDKSSMGQSQPVQPSPPTPAPTPASSSPLPPPSPLPPSSPLSSPSSSSSLASSPSSQIETNPRASEKHSRPHVLPFTYPLVFLLLTWLEFHVRYIPTKLFIFPSVLFFQSMREFFSELCNKYTKV
eukprot:TRINITY_DN8969_c0_g1_i1.p1 TRINITY_DN8969_c0_g1~~TRINITY_DN8969_c0_g1_i1.p1  ORF type:complete len:550 (-),score=90.93 TRINITY_DN8969_c0_g1_i1:28-1677(-)